MKNNINKFIVLLICIVVSTFVLIAYSQCSFLYKTNSFTDVNCYFTVGRSFLHGKLIYRDIYDHKGPVLYIFYIIAAFISENSFIGVFVVEVISYSIFIYYSYRTIEILTRNELFSLLSSFIVAFLIPKGVAFTKGGTLEEFALPMLMIPLYVVLKDVVDKKPINRLSAFTVGIFAATTFWMKFTLSGFFAGLIIFVIIYYLKYQFVKDYLLESVLWFLYGFFGVSTLIVFYFLLNGALKDLFIGYFYNNIFVYSDFHKPSFYSIFFPGIQTVLDNIIYGLLIIIGGTYMLVRIKKYLDVVLLLGLTVVFWCLSTYIGGVYWEYYGLPIGVLTFIGFIPIFDLLTLLTKIKRKIIVTALLIMVSISIVTTSIEKLKNIKLDNLDTEISFQNRFATLIKSDKNITLLNYGVQDLGIYNMAGIIPNFKYFYKPNNMPFVLEEQNKAITDKMFDYIVAYENTTFSGYSLIDEYSGCYLYKLD